MRPPFVSVIVPVFDDRERLMSCLDALERQTYDRCRYEVIVVDNNSEEAVGDLSSTCPRVRTVVECTPGSYAARNTGILAAQGDVIAFTDSDCLPSDAWLEEGVRALHANPRCGLLGGRIELFASDEHSPSPVELHEMVFGFRQENYVRQGYAATANAFTTRQVLSEVGMFDDALRSMGDKEWGQRVARSGYGVAYSAAAVVRHPARSSMAELVRKTERISGGRFVAVRRGGGTPWKARASTLLELRPPVNVAIMLAWERRLKTFRAKLAVLGVVMYVRYAYVREWIRLELGKEPRR